ncbi:uncharacterized protein DFL_007547 [Arthrobotrys flagrans]|uniref:Uncharacterized protein n=1 Tax=Arthrobotrys flagrans TaxID=97331 RepID=A0A436ZW02_ARTFL|nr:hypothetical protein DFL_007547 [Arthrobotrys flagrans]
MTTQCLDIEHVIQITEQMYRDRDPNPNRASRSYPDWNQMIADFSINLMEHFIDNEINKCEECQCKIGEEDDQKLWGLSASGTPGCPDQQTADGCQLIYGCHCTEFVFDPDEGVSGVLLQRLGGNTYLKGDKRLINDEAAQRLGEQMRNRMYGGSGSFRQLAPHTVEPYELEGPDYFGESSRSVHRLQRTRSGILPLYGDSYLAPANKWSRLPGFLKRSVETELEHNNSELTHIDAPSRGRRPPSPKANSVQSLQILSR